jgi:ribosomal protein S27E
VHGESIGPAYRPRQAERTVLYEVLAEHLEPFLARVAQAGAGLPAFVRRELRRFLECIRAHGFMRVRCPDCRNEMAVPFSCKGRGFCPSCGGRFMAQTAAHLVDRVLPDVPYRQWVLTLPLPAVGRGDFPAAFAPAPPPPRG